MVITLEEANRILAGAIATAEEFNIKIHVSVCDAGGRFVAFNRMDGAIWGVAYGAHGKAVASVAFGRTGRELAEPGVRVASVLAASANFG